jgi:hypothetical protein
MPAMHYKTIVLEMLQEQYPALHEALRTQRTLLQAVERYATDLKTSHDFWTGEYAQATPNRDPAQTASLALEPAIRDLQDALRCDSPPNPQDAGSFSLDEAIASIRRPSPPA